MQGPPANDNRQRVLITGGGGSIGGEIARQLCAAHDVTVLDNCEYNLYRAGRDLGVKCVYADIRDLTRMVSAFVDVRPHIVIHAAAMKHVSICEDNPCDAVLTNILGTKNTLEAARVSGARFCLISTDKAVRPTTILGATKRAAESIVGAAAPIVRFGNVVGSSGSVVPLFEAQIAAGGPVTVTHPCVTRYMMPIAEAARLAIQVALNAMSGVHVLDMGVPVRIVDLARGMIGGRDIVIEYTGLRRGEKLHEELFDGAPVASQFDGVFVESPPVVSDVWRAVSAARSGDNAAVRAILLGDGSGSIRDASSRACADGAYGARAYS